MHDRGPLLHLLLKHLGISQPAGLEVWQGWEINRVSGGANNLLFRATRDDDDLAVKFTIRDSRNRAGREYLALSALADLGLPIAPTPVLLDQDSYPHPVVVQTWLAGDVIAVPPNTDAEWSRLIEHFATVHTVTPQSTVTPFFDAVLNANSIDACRVLIHAHETSLPSDAQPVLLQSLIKRWERMVVVPWPAPPARLCRVDPNCSNIVRRPGRWASVDWENSGWGDPAFEIADLMAHPAYLGVARSRWEWVVDRYCSYVQDSNAAVRINVYYKTMLVWWVARFARALYEIPRGQDQRLVERPPDWETELRSKYQHYANLAEAIV